MNLFSPKYSENRYRVGSVIQAYDLNAIKRLDKVTWHNAENILNNLLDEIIPIKDTVTESQVKDLFNKAVCELEVLFGKSPLDDGSCCSGIYDYAGLNDFFAEILESLGFHTGRSERSDDDYMIDFVYGRNLADFDDDITK